MAACQPKINRFITGIILNMPAGASGGFIDYLGFPF